MNYSKQAIVLFLFVQLLTSCWGRYRLESNPLPIRINYWRELEDLGQQDGAKDIDLAEKYIPLADRIKHAHSAELDRRRKFLTDGSDIQGLWIMPGRR